MSGERKSTGRLFNAAGMHRLHGSWNAELVATSRSEPETAGINGLVHKPHKVIRKTKLKSQNENLSRQSQNKAILIRLCKHLITMVSTVWDERNLKFHSCRV